LKEQWQPATSRLGYDGTSSSRIRLPIYSGPSLPGIHCWSVTRFFFTGTVHPFSDYVFSLLFKEEKFHMYIRECLPSSASHSTSSNFKGLSAQSDFITCTAVI
jgi:hypothetical protein